MIDPKALRIANDYMNLVYTVTTKPCSTSGSSAPENVMRYSSLPNLALSKALHLVPLIALRRIAGLHAKRV